jgi:regulator of cell morphogenesis and NO signaling
MQITKDMQMAAVIHLNYLLLRVISRFDIRLGFGSKTVKQICREQNINLDFFLQVVNSFHDPDYFPDRDLQNFPVNLLVKYLKKTHDYYVQVKIPEIESYINRLLVSETMNKDNLSIISGFFNEYKKQFISHIEREENLVLPYVLQVEKAFLNKPVEYENEYRYCIDDFAREHDNLEDKLYDLKNIIIKFLPPVHDTETCNTMLIEIYRLEKDLNNHARMEDKVLVPKVRAMEQELAAG